MESIKSSKQNLLYKAFCHLVLNTESQTKFALLQLGGHLPCLTTKYGGDAGLVVQQQGPPRADRNGPPGRHAPELHMSPLSGNHLYTG